MIELHEKDIVHFDLKHENVLVNIDEFKGEMDKLKEFLSKTDEEPLCVVADYGEA